MGLTRASLNGVSRWTFSAWVYPLWVYPATDPLVIYSEGNTNATTFFWIYLDPANRSVVIGTWHVSRIGNWMTYTTPAGVISPNTWNFIEVALANGDVNSGNVTVYVNGNSYSGTLGSEFNSSTQYATIGAGLLGSTYYPFHGYIDEVAIFSPMGDPVQYYVQINNAPDFSGSWNVESGWISGTSWTITPETSIQTLYWRVQARDTNTGAVSPWSAVDSFNTH